LYSKDAEKTTVERPARRAAAWKWTIEVVSQKGFAIEFLF
jgi:hypothetical protein